MNQFRPIGTAPASAVVISCGICAIHATISIATLLAFPTNHSLVSAVSPRIRSTRTTAGTGACVAIIAYDFPTSPIVEADSEPTVAGVRAVLLELSSSSRRTKMFPPTPNQLVRRLRVPARKPRLIGLIPEPFSAESRCAASSALFGKRQGSARHVTSFHFAAMRPITNCIPCDRQHHDFKYHLGRGHTGTRSGTWARSWPFRNARDSSETHHTMLRGSRSSRFR